MKIFNRGLVSRAVLTALFLGVCGLTGQAVFAASPSAVNLGSAGNYVILAKTGISTTGSTSVVGNLGLSPAAASYITGFALTLPAAGAFSTSALVTGNIYAPGYADPTPSILTTAVLDMQSAYTNAAGRAADVTELGAGNIGGLTLAPGVYKWGTGLTIPTNVTLSGGANDVWIFQVAGNLNISSAVQVVLAGGARAANIFWQVAGQTTIGTTAVFNGNVLDQTTIVLNTGAVLNGRALAQAAVTLDASTVTLPTSGSSSPSPAPSPSPSPSSTPAPSPSPSPSLTPAPTSSTSQNADANMRANLQVQLTGLLATMRSLEEQVQARQQGMNPNANAYINANMNASFKRDITFGSTGDDVRMLQVWLNTHGHAVASSGAGSSGNETTLFGGLTRKAVAKFQASVGISPASGNFGPITRAYISAHY